MVESENSSFERVFCNVSGTGSRRHARALGRLGERLGNIALETIREYEAKYKELNLVGSVIIFLEDVPKTDSNGEPISSCDVMLRKTNPFITDSESFSRWYLRSATGDEICFFVPLSLRLEKAYIRMILWNLNENIPEANKALACELETLIIQNCIAAMPRGNSFTDGMAQKAMQKTADSTLARYEFENYDDFAICMRAYGLNSEEDESILKYAWQNCDL